MQNHISQYAMETLCCHQSGVQLLYDTSLTAYRSYMTGLRFEPHPGSTECYYLRACSNRMYRKTVHNIADGRIPCDTRSLHSFKMSYYTMYCLGRKTHVPNRRSISSVNPDQHIVITCAHVSHAVAFQNALSPTHHGYATYSRMQWCIHEQRDSHVTSYGESGNHPIGGNVGQSTAGCLVFDCAPLQ
jgi:hypothetical protein